MLCPCFVNEACPDRITAVTINQTVIDFGDGGAASLQESWAGITVPAGAIAVALAHLPAPGTAVQVHVNGVLQRASDHYTISGADIRFSFVLEDSDVAVTYMYLLPA